MSVFFQPSKQQESNTEAQSDSPDKEQTKNNSPLEQIPAWMDAISKQI